MTREIPLSQGRAALVDDADYEWLSRWKWCYFHVRNANTGYAGRRQGNRYIYMHRVIMAAPEGVPVDHQDQNGLNNTRANLRLCTTSQNGQNRTKRRECSSQYKGVSRHKATGRWYASIAINGRCISLGYFSSELDAALTYNAKAIELFGEFARLNPIPESE